MEWTVEETKRLFELCEQARRQGKGLKFAFDKIAAEVNRKPNSVRNYYYAHLKTLSLVPDLSKRLGIEITPTKTAGFKTFEPSEIDNLIKLVLIEQAKGKSVRSITTEMAGGDKSLMLRLQNKYRSVVFRQRKKTEGIMRELKADRQTYLNPYTKAIVKDGVESPMDEDALLNSLKTITGTLEDEQVKEMFKGLAKLVQLASAGGGVLVGGNNDNRLREIDSLRRENTTLKSTLERLTKREGIETEGNIEQLKQLNRYFLEKADNDKIKGLGDYVSELGKLLTKTN